MTVSLTYDSVLSRVKVSATGLTGASTAIVERSTDGIRWTTVRGGGAVPVIGGTFATPVSDFEFPTDVTITYRVSGVDPAPAAFVAVGTGSAGANGSRTPALPAGIVAGDVLLLLASTRNTGVGTPDIPTDWHHLAGTGNLRVFGRVWDGVFAAPTVTYTGGATNETTLAQIAAFRNVKLSPVSAVIQNNVVADQDIAFAGQGELSQLGMLVVYVGWKADDWTSVDNITDGYTVEISELSSTAGNDAGQVWDYYLPATTAAIDPGAFFVTGGTPALSRGGTVALQHADGITPQTATITPHIGAVWLKSISRPFLNRPVDTVFASSIGVARKSRATTFPVIGRTLPVAVSSVRGSREWTMLIRTETTADRDRVDYLCASGDVLLIQAPPNSGVETGFVSVGDVSRQAHPLRPLSNLWTLPMTEVAAPAPEVVGAIGTWQTVLDRYATWADVIAAQVSWATLLTIIGDPSEVIVP